MISPAARLTLADDPTPVERATVDDILSHYQPETFLWVVFHRSDGSARDWYAWTAGGQPVGDYVDRCALGSGLDAADWLHIVDRHCLHSTRGRIAIQAYPLPPILADVVGGIRGPERWRTALRQLGGSMATGRQVPSAAVPRWLGVGPALLTGGTR